MKIFEREIQYEHPIRRVRQLDYVAALAHPSGMTVELIDAMGDDLAIVNAARVSYGKETSWEGWYWNDCLGIYTQEKHLCHTHSLADWEKTEYAPPNPQLYRLSKQDMGVLNYMMRERHGSPFEMAVLKFRIKAPIGVVWEWVRHRIASYNIMSTRYVEWDKDYYIPEAKQWRKQVGKPGHYQYVEITDQRKLKRLQNRYIKAMEQAFSHYGFLVEQGLAKEVARNVLPMGSMTQMIWCVNARSLMNFLSLRNESHALEEIQICASMVEKLTHLVIPDTMRLFNEYDRRTP